MRGLVKHKAISSIHQSVKSERVFRPWDYAIYGLLTLMNLVVVGSCTVIWFRAAHWWPIPLPFAVMSLLFFGNLAMYEMRWLTLPLMRRPKPMVPRQDWAVGVATTFVPGVES